MVVQDGEDELLQDDLLGLGGEDVHDVGVKLVYLHPRTPPALICRQKPLPFFFQLGAGRFYENEIKLDKVRRIEEIVEEHDHLYVLEPSDRLPENLVFSEEELDQQECCDELGRDGNQTLTPVDLCRTGLREDPGSVRID